MDEQAMVVKDVGEASLRGPTALSSTQAGWCEISRVRQFLIGELSNMLPKLSFQLKLKKLVYFWHKEELFGREGVLGR